MHPFCKQLVSLGSGLGVCYSRNVGGWVIMWFEAVKHEEKGNKDKSSEEIRHLTPVHWSCLTSALCTSIMFTPSVFFH